MKPAISYGLKDKYDGLDIIEITKKDNFYYYGREWTGAQTRGRLSDLLAEFESKVEAQACILDVGKAKAATAGPIAAAAKLARQAEDARREAVRAAILKHKKGNI